jgi:hypothetical protein
MIPNLRQLIPQKRVSSDNMFISVLSTAFTTFVVVIIIGAIFVWAGMTDIYNKQHMQTQTLNITYQHDNNKENWQKFPDIKCEYQGKIYTTCIFHGYMDLSKNKAKFNIYSDTERGVYKVEFGSYEN